MIAHNVKVGDLFCMSWGYDQTNIEFFQVVRTSANSVWVREIAARSVPGSQGFMCENVTPVKDSFLENSSWCGAGNPPTMRRVKVYCDTPHFSFQGRYNARPTTTETPHFNSWYA